MHNNRILKKNDNLRRRIRSEKVSDYSFLTLNFGTPMGLSFEHSRAVGARKSEKQTLEWWISALSFTSHVENYKKNHN